MNKEFEEIYTQTGLFITNKHKKSKDRYTYLPKPNDKPLSMKSRRMIADKLRSRIRKPPTLNKPPWEE